MSESIIEPDTAVWRSGDLVVRVTVEEDVLLGTSTDIIRFTASDAVELERLLDNALRWLNRRLAIENNNTKGTTP